jgi:class 3 adenylate cyclase/predicted ATPase
MECPKCGSDNPDSKKFCRKCGERLVIICPQCKAEIDLGDKFCGDCGYDLALTASAVVKDLSIDEKFEKLKHFLPKDVTEKIIAQRDKIEGEHKSVTVMFCDMEGFTTISEKLSAEHAYSIMARVYEILIRNVHDFEGTVNDMTGDGIMALFGAPTALEDAPQRAVRSACAVHREISRFNNQIKKEQTGLPQINMRIGIHTGPVVVGTIGNDRREEFKAVGDTVNLASRIEGLAEAGTTYVSGDTFKLTEGMFRYEALGEKQVKGRDAPVSVYRVIAPSSRKTRFDINAERGLTSFVGRERELELLLDGFERVKSGRGQAFSVTAEAGVGKSRLLYEFRKAISNEDVTFLEGKCLSYSRGLAYHPVIDILKINFDISGSDTDSHISDKVKKGLKALGADESSTLPFLLELLSVKDSGIDMGLVSPEVGKARILDALKRIVLKGSEVRPLIMAIEDLHWIDDSSEEALKEILESISGVRVLLIFTYRPEFVHTWGGRSYHCQVNLNRFSNRESLLMAYNILGTKELSADLEEFILERSEGVPFFIEEFITSLRDLKVIVQKGDKFCAVKDLKDVTIPSTIQDVIMARVDSLPGAAKTVLQTGSVIGREFGYELIKEVTGVSEKELLSHLSILKDSELIFERGIYPKSTYIFKHALTQDAAYYSLLQSTRRKYHEKVVRVLEAKFPEIVRTHPEILGHHCTEADLSEDAIPYWRRAGEIAIRRSAHTVATDHFSRSLEMLNKMPAASRSAQLELDLQALLGNTLMTVKGYGAPEVKQALDRCRELCQQVGESSQLFSVLHGLWIFYIAQAETQTSHELAQQCLDLSLRLEDPASITEAHHALGSNYLWRGEYVSASEHFEQGIKLYDSHSFDPHVLPPGREDPGIIHKSHSAHVLWILGYPERSLERIKTALELGRELDHPFSMVFAQFSDALVHLLRGEYDLALEQAKIAVETSVEMEFVFFQGWSRVYMGAAMAALGRGEEGIPHIKSGLDLCGEAGVKAWRHHDFFLAEAYGRVGKISEGLDTITKALPIIKKHGTRFFESELHRLKGELFLKKESPDVLGAETELKKALEIAGRRQAKSLELRAAVSMSRLWQKQGKEKESYKLLSDIYGWFTEGFDTNDLKEAKKLIKDLTDK